MKTTNRREFLAAAGIGVAGLSFIGCTSTSTVINTLGLVVDAAEVALPDILALAGVPASISTLATEWLSAVSTIVPEVTTELQSSDPVTIQLQKIVGYFAPVINGPAFTGSVPPEVSAIVGTVLAAIQAFLKVLAGGSAQLTAAKVQSAGRVWTASDRHVLSSIASRADKLHAQIATASKH
jgi:hypothetical protein